MDGAAAVTSASMKPQALPARSAWRWDAKRDAERRARMADAGQEHQSVERLDEGERLGSSAADEGMLRAACTPYETPRFEKPQHRDRNIVRRTPHHHRMQHSQLASQICPT